MKTVNLVIAIIYSCIFGAMLLMALMDNDSELVMGTVMLAVPVIINWISYAKWPKYESDSTKTS